MKLNFWSKLIGMLVMGFSTSSQLMAQNNSVDYENNRIFIKLQNEVNWKLPEFKTANEVSKLESLPEFQRIAQAYGINYLVHPFKTHSTELDRTYELRFTNTENLDELIKQVARLDYIEYVEKIEKPRLQVLDRSTNNENLSTEMYRTSYVTNDPLLSNQSYINNINTNFAWDLTKGSESVTIAVLTDEIYTGHPDLAPNIFTNPKEIAGNNLDDDGNGYIDDVHGWDSVDDDNDTNPAMTSSGSTSWGTSFVGVACAQADNGIGIAGTGFNCNLIPVRCVNSSNSAQSNFYGALDYAINCGYTRVLAMTTATTSFSQTLQNLIDAAYDRDLVCIACTGISGNNVATYPSAYNHVIGVAGINIFDEKSYYSNYHTTIDVSCYADNITTTDIHYSPNLSPSYSNGMIGTAYSSCITAGVAGLMLSVNPCLTPDSLEYYLKTTTDDIYSIPANAPYQGLLGTGRVNAEAAVNAVSPTAAPTNANFSVDILNCSGIATFQYTPTTITGCGTEYNWDFGDGTVGSGYTVSHPYTNPGTYTVSLTVENSLGTVTSTQNITIVPIQTINVNAGPDLTTCPTVGVQLNPTVTGTYTSLNWSPISGLSNPNILNPIATPNTTTTYTLTLSNASGCSASDAVKVQITAPPQIYAGADVSKAAGTDITLNATGLGGTSYSWAPTTELLTPNAQSTICQATSTRTYTVTLTSAGGCSKSDALLVTVWPVGIEDAQVGTLGAVVPNPIATTASLKANFEQAGNLRIRLFDAMGRQVQDIYEGNVIPGDFFLSFERKAELAAGMYMIAWELNGKITTQKVQLN